MGLDINLLYGEMAGSWILHLAFPVLASVIIGILPRQSLSSSVLTILGITVILSFLTQFGFLAYLQSAACGGVKDYAPVATGAGLGAVITGLMTALPLYVEPLRLAVSQLFGSHYALQTPELEKISGIIKQASLDVGAVSTGQQTGGALQMPKAIPFLEYEEQTLREMMIGASYWAAFAGAYGVGFGSLLNTTCPATTP
jgi:hypothetical protein